MGLTRAQDRLYLSHPARPSRFLRVIDTGLFESLGATRRLIESGVHQIDLPVPTAPAGLTRTAAGKVFRAVTGRRLPRMRVAAPPVWSTNDSDTEAPMLRAWLDSKLERLTGGSSDPQDTDR